MASIIKRGDTYRVVVSHKGQRESATFPTKAECKAWAAERESAYRTRKITGVIPGKTVGDVLDEYLEKVSPTKRGYDWERKRIRVLKGYKIALVRLSDLDATHVSKWRDDRLKDVSGSSVCRDWNLLSHALETARKEWRWINANPFKNEVSRPKVAPPRSKTFDETEVLAICTALGDTGIAGRVKDAFLFALETAMRAGEIVGIQKEDIHDNYVHLIMTKNGSPRDVPLSQKAKEILAKYPDGFGLTSSQLDANFRRGTRLAGVTGQFRDSRATALTRLATVFPNALDLAKVSGHKDLRILLNVYYRPSVDDLAEKMK
jgi:integrase